MILDSLPFSRIGLSIDAEWNEMNEVQKSVAKMSALYTNGFILLNKKNLKQKASFKMKWVKMIIRGEEYLDTANITNTRIRHTFFVFSLSLLASHRTHFILV